MVGTENLNICRHVLQFYGRDEELAEKVTLARGCRPRGQVAGSRSATTRSFACSRQAPAAARHFAVATVNAWGAGDLSDDAALVVTELAANAVVHARSAFTVVLSARDDLLRISVRDESPPAGAGPRATPLHGLAAVDALASRWGVESLGNAGKTVWVELPR